jgi:hypothetical protein
VDHALVPGLLIPIALTELIFRRTSGSPTSGAAAWSAPSPSSSGS